MDELKTRFFGIQHRKAEKPAWVPAKDKEVFDDSLTQSKVKDPEYCQWYLSLCGRLAVEDELLPFKIDIESDEKKALDFFCSIFT